MAMNLFYFGSSYGEQIDVNAVPLGLCRVPWFLSRWRFFDISLVQPSSLDEFIIIISLKKIY